MLLSICKNSDVLNLMRIIKIVINLIRIVVPIILMIFVMLDYSKAVSSNKIDDANKLFVKKIIAAIIIFLLPTFVNVVFKVTDTNKEYYSCLENATSEGIKKAKFEEIQSYILGAEKSLNIQDYNLAKNKIQKVKDVSERQQLYASLSALDKYMEISQMIDSLQISYTSNKYNEVSNLINALPASDAKYRLIEKFKKIKTNSGGNNSNVSGNYTASNDKINAVINEVNKSMYSGSDNGVSGLCAAWVSKIYNRALGISISGNANDFWSYAVNSGQNSKEPQPGMFVAVRHANRDSSTEGYKYGHIGIYAGNGKVIGRNGSTVAEMSLSDWKKIYDSFGEIAWAYPKEMLK